MGSFANLTAQLNLNIQNFAANMRRASSMTNQFASNLKGQINGGLVEPAKQSKFEFKDVARIVQGIIISKAFYSGLNAIRNCADAVWEFTQQLEYAKMAYSNLFGDTALAQEFINVLKDFAATTPFTFSQSEAAAKRLLAYGIQYKNVMYVMRGVLAASTMQNNPQTIESVSRALGQIYTKGRLMNEEMRQLAEAGIPAYEILQQKLGLTAAQLQNLGDQAIPASVAINALVDGMNERFGNVVNASTKTLQGIISNLKDNATMVASGIFQPLYDGIKSVLNTFAEFVAHLREVYELSGIGGLFEAIFPEEMHDTLRQFAANLIALVQAIWRLVSAVSGVLAPVIKALINVFNAFAPILTTVANVLSVLVDFITSNATAMKILTAALAAAATMWVIFKVKALASTVIVGVVTLISKALSALSTVLTFVVAHPFWALLLGLAGVVVGLSGGFGKLSDAISGYFKKLTSLNGVDPDKLLLPSQEERANDLNKFNQALDGTSDAMDNLADSTGKATKAAKGLLSFDEVFKLNQPDEGTDNGIIPDLGLDFEMPDFSELTESLIPEFPDLTEEISNYVTDFTNKFKEELVGAGIGAIIGGVIGGALGGPVGAKIGAAIGALAGWFWDDLAEKLGLTDTGKIALPISTGLGAAIGSVVGGPAGAAVGGAIGTLVGWLIDSIAKGLETGDWSDVGYPIGIGLGAAIGTAVGGPVGGLIGSAIGALVGWIVDLIVENWDVIWEYLSDAYGGLTIILSHVVDYLKDWFPQLGDKIKGWLEGLWGMFPPWLQNAITYVKDWLSEAWTVVTTKISEVWTYVTTWLSDARTNVITWFSEMSTSVHDWFNNVRTDMVTWFVDLWTNISSWFNNVRTSMVTWFVDLWTNISGWLGNTWNSITTWFTNMFNNVSTWFSNTKNAVVTWLSNIWTNVTQWLSNTISNVRNWFSNLLQTTVNGLRNILNSIINWFKNLWNNIWDSLKSIGNKIGDWWDNLWGNKSAKVSVSASGEALTSAGGRLASLVGHSTGGVFNREHIARFNEGNKPEAIIPLDTESAMQPFVDAVANGLTATLMPLVASVTGNQDQRQPVYVGTLIADDSGLKELERKMRIIRIKEERRGG